MKSNLKRTLFLINLFIFFTIVESINDQNNENNLLKYDSTEQDNTQLKNKKAIPNPEYKIGNDSSQNG